MIRCELSSAQRCVRCDQGHSAGGCVRPDDLPEPEDSNYIIHGDGESSSRIMTIAGMPRGQRLHIRIYECGQNGAVSGGNTIRIESDDVAVASARRCADASIG